MRDSEYELTHVGRGWMPSSTFFAQARRQQLPPSAMGLRGEESSRLHVPENLARLVPPVCSASDLVMLSHPSDSEETYHQIMFVLKESIFGGDQEVVHRGLLLGLLPLGIELLVLFGTALLGSFRDGRV